MVIIASAQGKSGTHTSIDKKITIDYILTAIRMPRSIKC